LYSPWLWLRLWRSKMLLPCRLLGSALLLYLLIAL
jgi:hypothetical protein